MKTNPKKNVLFTEEGEVQPIYDVLDNHNDTIDYEEAEDNYYDYWDDSNENDD